MPLYITTVTGIALVKDGDHIWPWTLRFRRLIKAKDKWNGRPTLVPAAHIRSVELFTDEAWLDLLKKEEAHRAEHRKAAQAKVDKVEKVVADDKAKKAEKVEFVDG